MGEVAVPRLPPGPFIHPEVPEPQACSWCPVVDGGPQETSCSSLLPVTLPSLALTTLPCPTLSLAPVSWLALQVPGRLQGGGCEGWRGREVDRRRGLWGAEDYKGARRRAGDTSSLRQAPAWSRVNGLSLPQGLGDALGLGPGMGGSTDGLQDWGLWRPEVLCGSGSTSGQSSHPGRAICDCKWVWGVVGGGCEHNYVTLSL